MPLIVVKAYPKDEKIKQEIDPHADEMLILEGKQQF